MAAAVSREDVLNCSFSCWHALFRPHSIPAWVLVLPPSFVAYLLADGIILPEAHYNHQQYHSVHTQDSEGDSGDDSSPWLFIADAPASDVTAPFSDFHAQLSNIMALHAPVFPKLNWSAPKDANWLLPDATIKCYTTSDVYLLLKSSDHILFDLTQMLPLAAQDDPDAPHDEKFELVLKQWFNINPSLEFRVFVRDNHIIAISQKDPNYYLFLHSMSHAITSKISFFFDSTIKNVFPSKNYVLDLYLPTSNNKIYIIDINPFFSHTDSLLFTWDELLSLSSSSSASSTQDFPFELRLVEKFNTSTFSSKKYSESQLPKDVLDSSTDTQSMVDLIKNWQSLMENDQSSDSDSDSNSDSNLNNQKK
ncbi:cell proliferation protein CDC123 [Ascoidea rubescens DSM 1968]|uniref:D123-domain-containing protein n=1 Tax=Ascoidea rubescens DSM 1968 TaxID=1344418 RepID=A0A1D2V9V1_9ASCO|nr:D123-domain-containing protein [Ascoidea rubescens DSM 1968]ODV58243.1 D123-domain-containing protein [Ascoidea rubescens DSM 1968]